MNAIHAYAWMFATLLFILAIQLAPGALTGNVTLASAGLDHSQNSNAWMGLFVVLALALGIMYARYRHFTHP
ncbi:MAG: LPXTG cell wall anchor domain-containing protein [Candidatus Iainarchaeum archaeon]|uniref:LPXTG cell wall anchor domain-containing protein n=1 Tax=Candidatus Iainarchaeum sp. TaxID=3101447 RepID=A0A7T9DK62_9ARCH|nr:MAG: LPXTG cell wall anchor domain-containing protein [Candidatus Diapherotrites archaeon]